MMESWLQDVRYGLRTLRKSPAFTTVAVLTLALGIGLNTTLFSAFDAVALRPLPVKDSGRVVRLERWFERQSIGDVQYAFSYPEYTFYRNGSHVFSDLVAVSFPLRAAVILPADAAGRSSRQPENARCQLVSANYFSDLGVTPLMGRTFITDENQTAGGHPVVVVSYPFWQGRLNGDPQAVGKILIVNDTVFTVIGVAPQDFAGTGIPAQVPDFWAPLVMQAQILPGTDWLNQPTDHEVQLLGHLAPGMNRSNAQAEVQVLARQFEHDHPSPTNKTVAVTLQPATFFGNTEDVRFKAVVALLMTIVGMVLLIACANLANMLLARASGRQREIGVRLALGASRFRLVRQLLTESVLLAVIGGAAGLVLSLWASRLVWLAIEQVLGMQASLVAHLGPDVRIFTYTFLLSVATGVLFGLSPAWHSSRPDLAAALKDAGTTFGQRLHRSRLRSLLVAGQVAVSMLFLVSAGLLVRGLVRSQAVDPGFETRSVFPLGMYWENDQAKTNAFRVREIESIQGSPQVQSTALVYHVPMTGTWTPAVTVESSKASPRDLPGGSLANYVSASYFTTLGIPIMRGRNFTRPESETGAPLVIVSESAARTFWPGEDPIGKHVKIELIAHGPWGRYEVVGVAKDVRTANLSRVDPAYIYLPTDLAKLYDYTLLVRLQGDQRTAFASVAKSLEELDKRPRPSFTLINLEDGPLQAQKLMAKSLTLSAISLACLALVLAAIGIYGVMAYLVSQREREIGIRMALGATPTRVLRLVLRQGMRPVILGGVAGLVASLGVAGVLKAILISPGSVDLLFGVGSFDPLTFTALAGFLAGIALLACYIPARRVTKVDPMAALRYE